MDAIPGHRPVPQTQRVDLPNLSSLETNRGREGGFVQRQCIRNDGDPIHPAALPHFCRRLSEEFGVLFLQQLFVERK
jgi:hypothetical protein